MTILILFVYETDILKENRTQLAFLVAETTNTKFPHSTGSDDGDDIDIDDHGNDDDIDHDDNIDDSDEDAMIGVQEV